MLRRLHINPWFCIALLALLFCAFEATPIELRAGGLPLDLWVQDRLFDFSSKAWLVPKKAQPWDLIFYKGALAALYALAAAMTALLCVPKRKWAALGAGGAWFADKWNIGFLLACMAVIPVSVAISKTFTDVYVPADLARYFGEKGVPYVHVMEPYPADFLARRAAEHIKPGMSFPAGHASGGFALMAFFFVWPGRWKWLGLAAGLGVGSVMGIYKMLIGDHYLSHTLITCAFAWCACVALVRAREWARRKWVMAN